MKKLTNKLVSGLMILCMLATASAASTTTIGPTSIDSGKCYVTGYNTIGAARSNEISSAKTKIQVNADSYMGTVSATFNYVYYQNSGSVSAGTLKTYTSSNTVSCGANQGSKTATVSYVPPTYSSVVQIQSTHTVKDSNGTQKYSRSIYH